MIKGTNIYIRPFLTKDAEALLELFMENRDFFEKFSMERNETFIRLNSSLRELSNMKKTVEPIKHIILGFLNMMEH